MHVMKFAHRRVARLQHLDVKPVRDIGERLGTDLRGEAIHEIAPAPERVGDARAIFGEARHRALERVRVQVRHAGHDRPLRPFDARRRGAARRDAHELAAFVPFEKHVAPPPVGEARVVCKECAIRSVHVQSPFLYRGAAAWRAVRRITPCRCRCAATRRHATPRTPSRIRPRDRGAACRLFRSYGASRRRA